MARSLELSRWTRVPSGILLSLMLLACKDTAAPNTPISLGRRLLTGETVACALTSTGAVYCWGLASSFWEYGAAPGVISGNTMPTPADIRALYSLGRGVSNHFCGTSPLNQGVCWGRGSNGQLGTGFTATGNPPATLDSDVPFADIYVGRLTTCGLSTTGTAYCWGFNQYGEIGNSAIALAATSVAPVAVEGGYTFKSLAVGWLHACGVTTANETYCWGKNTSGQLGIGITDTTRYRTPQLVTGGLNFTQIALGSLYTCGLEASGDAYCWGENSTGQLGDGTVTVRPQPTLVSGGLKFTQLVTSSGFANGAAVAAPVPLAGGVGHTCALTAAGAAYCWGWNGSGELGDGTQVDKMVPTLVSGGLTFSTLGAGGAYTCGMKGNAIWCWGSNTQGQIGIGSTASTVTVPTALLAPFDKP